MKKILFLFLIGMMFSSVAVGAMINTRPWGSADPGSLDELQTGVFDAIGSTIDVIDDQTGFAYFEPTSPTSATTYIATISWYFPNLEFGIYELGDTSTKLKLFDEATSSVGDIVHINFNLGLNYVEARTIGGTLVDSTDYFKQFGWYARTTTSDPTGGPPTYTPYYYSEDTLNPSNEAHFLAYEANGDDVTIGTLGEYNDVGHWYIATEADIPENSTVGGDFTDFVVQVESVRPIPVPGAILLGILGLSAAGLKLRKFA